MELDDLRLQVYRSFAQSGSPPLRARLREAFGSSDEEIRAGLRELSIRKLVVLDQDEEILMAHPFSALPMGFAVMGEQTLWWGGCAWDAFALPHLLGDESPMLVSTRCPACSTPHIWNIGRDAPPAGEQAAHFLVPVSQMWDDIVHACGHQRIFCSTGCIDTWLELNGRSRGYVMDMESLWRLASHWYDGRLDRGYLRRNPEEATEYFRGVGLHGSFWGL